MTIQDTRIRALCEAPASEEGDHVLYWMQASQRARANHALEYAIDVANTRGQPLVVLFVLIHDFPEGTERTYAFMLEGLKETAEALDARGIPFVFRLGDMVPTVLEAARKASVVVTDRGYLAFQRDWRADVAEAVGRRFVEVESNAVVPLEVASTRLESAARTIRPKITKVLEDYLQPVDARDLETRGKTSWMSDLDPRDVETCLKTVRTDRSVGRVTRFRGGTSEALGHLDGFVEHHLDGYKAARSEPSKPATSTLSPYLHYGMISPVEAVLRVRAAGGGKRGAGVAGDPDADIGSTDRGETQADPSAPLSEDAASFVEELVVRRELAHNFVAYEPDYGTWASIPDWAKATLKEHADDPVDARYTPEQLRDAQTGDPYWNAAQTEMLKSGYMHNYMRMYWGKQIVYWFRDGEDAFQTALSLNNTYFLDGRDANSYSNVSWLFGIHDRPWPVQPGFGKVRSMKASGLKRKFDPDAYVAWVDRLDG